MNKKQYIISRCLRLGEMPLYLVFYSNKLGKKGQCIMLCTFAKLKQLVRGKYRFTDPYTFGVVLYNGVGEQSYQHLDELLKARYCLELSSLEAHEVKLRFRG